MATTAYGDIEASPRQLHQDDSRLWPVGCSGGMDTTVVDLLALDAVADISASQRLGHLGEPPVRGKRAGQFL
jgi:NH3-dependent NAD+ synthetase